MKQRILTGWNFIRVLYLLSGILIIIQSISEHQWLGIIFGGYFASMGLFAFGCAAGSCYYQPRAKDKQEMRSIDFEEIK